LAVGDRLLSVRVRSLRDGALDDVLRLGERERRRLCDDSRLFSEELDRLFSLLSFATADDDEPEFIFENNNFCICTYRLFCSTMEW